MSWPLRSCPRHHQFGVRFHVDTFGNLADLQDHILRSGLVDRQSDPGLDVLRETRLFYDQLVRADRQVGKQECAGGVGRRILSETRVDIAYGHLRSRRDGAGGIRYGSPKTRRGVLREHGNHSCRQEHQYESRPYVSRAPGNRGAGVLGAQNHPPWLQNY